MKTVFVSPRNHSSATVCLCSVHFLPLLSKTYFLYLTSGSDRTLRYIMSRLLCKSPPLCDEIELYVDLFCTRYWQFEKWFSGRHELSCSIAERLLKDLVLFAQISRCREISGFCCVRRGWFFLLVRKTSSCLLWLVRRLTCGNFRERTSIFTVSVLTSTFLCVSSSLMSSSREHERKTPTKQNQGNKNPRVCHVAGIVSRDQPNEIFRGLVCISKEGG